MKRIMLIVAYDGTEYAGWQRQNNAITVEEVLENALSELTGENIDVAGASRTDAGVHAYGNVAVFDTDSSIPGERFAPAVNSYLPEDIRVMYSEEADKSFHPRYSDSLKTYQYHIINTEIVLPTMNRYAYHVYETLDVNAMRAASSCLIGEHDFSAFCSAGSQVKDKIRTIHCIDIDAAPLYKAADELPDDDEPEENYDQDICIRITGNGFLYNMVRIIAGTLIEVGLGRRSVDSVEKALSEKKRESAGPTAPAKGLLLEGIQYTEV